MLSTAERAPAAGRGCGWDTHSGVEHPPPAKKEPLLKEPKEVCAFRIRRSLSKDWLQGGLGTPVSKARGEGELLRESE